MKELALFVVKKLVDMAKKDPKAVANMIKDALGHKFHWGVADYMQRAARHIAGGGNGLFDMQDVLGLG